MHLALDDVLSPRALEKMIEANVKQDRLLGQIGHDEYHFDNNAFKKSYAYIEEQRVLMVSALMANDALSAWSAFGRLTHTAQDFYAHSNYVALWLAREHLRAMSKDHNIPADKIDPLDPRILYNSGLRSGQTYFPWDYLSFFQPIAPLIRRFAPLDSHTHMNLDTPDRGPKFAYAYAAAFKRTRYESSSIMKILPQDLLWIFTGGMLKRNSEALTC
jgi:hypothetical protein